MPPKRQRRSFGRIAQLPSGRYRARYIGPDGILHSAPYTFSAKMDAEGWLSREHRLIELQSWSPPKEREKRKESESRTVTEAVTEYIVARDLRPGTVRGYTSILNNRIDPYLGRITVGDLTQQAVNAWLTDMTTDHPETRSRNSQAYGLLDSVMTREVENGILESNPCRSREARRPPRPERTPMPTQEEYRAILENLSDRYRLMTEVIASCALRLGEATELRVKDYRETSSDPLVVTLSISRTVSWLVGGPVVGSPKSEAGIRVVTVPPHIADRLSRHVAKRREDGGPEALLFLNRREEQIRATKYREVFVRAATKAGRGDLSPHDLRHFGAVQAARAGATVKELMQRLGHTTPVQAMHYQHVAKGRDAEIASRMSDFF